MPPITKAEAARRKKVSRAAVTLAARPDGPLHPAVGAGGKLDPAHPAFRAWLGEETRGPDGGKELDDELRRLNRRKRAAEAEKLELANAEKRGSLISRELVQTHVFGLINATFQRLLGDGARAIATRVASHTRSNGSAEEGLAIVRGVISSHLGHVRESSRRSLGVAAPKPTKKRKPHGHQ